MQPPVKVNMSTSTKQRSSSLVRQTGAGVLLGTALTNNIPDIPGVNKTVVFVAMFLLGGAVFLAEHYLGDPSTGTTPAAPTTTTGTLDSSA